jgi:hypothetical protein
LGQLCKGFEPHFCVSGKTSFHPDKSRERENLAIKGNVSKDQYQSGEVKY